jgi:nitroimidazol reductase NimA-like FMN-containing flavoprotein (pyridoxamine 5'-phosphate oxidase superfamily)
MYKEMRKKDRQRGEKEAFEYLEKAQWGVLSLAAGGLPYGVPLCHAVSGRTIYAHCAREGQKLDFIRMNAKACYTAVAHGEPLRDKGSVEYECVMAFGPVRIVEDAGERMMAFDAINAKYTDSAELGRSFVEMWGNNTVVLALDIGRITAKSTR